MVLVYTQPNIVFLVLKVLCSDARITNACSKISLILRGTMQLYIGSDVSDNQIGAILALLSLRRLVTTDRLPGPIALIARPVS
jgi:hypothetical protein